MNSALVSDSQLIEKIQARPQSGHVVRASHHTYKSSTKAGTRFLTSAGTSQKQNLNASQPSPGGSQEKHKASKANGLELVVDDDEFLKEPARTIKMSAHQQERPTGPIIPLPQKSTSKARKRAGESPNTRKSAALFSFDVPLHQIAAPATATNAITRVQNAFGTTLSSGVDLFTDHLGPDVKSSSTAQTLSHHPRSKALAMGARTSSGHPVKRTAQRRSVNLKGKLSGTRLTSGASRPGLPRAPSEDKKLMKNNLTNRTQLSTLIKGPIKTQDQNLDLVAQRQSSALGLFHHPSGDAPFEADASPLHGKKEDLDLLSHDEQNIQIDGELQYIRDIPSASDRFSAVRDFVSKERVSLKQVHNIIDNINHAQQTNLENALSAFRRNRNKKYAMNQTEVGNS
jgi:hypothetical protein